MIIVMKSGASKKEKEVVMERVRQLGYAPHPIYGKERTVIGAVGDERGKANLQLLESLPGVEMIIPILKPFKLAGREFKAEDTIIRVRGREIGGKKLTIIAGPCSVESRGQILETAQAVKEAGATMLRGGAFKPRTSPYSFQGLEERGLKLLAEARERTGLPIVTEVISPEDISLVSEYADVLQVGARNMLNFALLKRLGKVKKPILLKRGMMATIEELLMSAEYILSQRNYAVVLCERGIRTFESYTRNTLDLNAIPLIKKLSHLPIIVDPSHGTGDGELVPALSKAAIAAGADGLMIEVHPCPSEAYSDGKQSLSIPEFLKLMEELKPFIQAAGRN